MLGKGAAPRLDAMSHAAVSPQFILQRQWQCRHAHAQPLPPCSTKTQKSRDARIYKAVGQGSTHKTEGSKYGIPSGRTTQWVHRTGMCAARTHLRRATTGGQQQFLETRQSPPCPRTPRCSQSVAPTASQSVRERTKAPLPHLTGTSGCQAASTVAPSVGRHTAFHAVRSTVATTRPSKVGARRRRRQKGVAAP